MSSKSQPAGGELVLSEEQDPQAELRRRAQAAPKPEFKDFFLAATEIILEPLLEPLIRGYDDVRATKVDATSGWPNCANCGVQLPNMCVHCSRCRHLTYIYVPEPGGQSGGGLSFLGNAGLMTATLIAAAAMENAQRNRAMLRALGIRRRRVLLPGLIAVLPLFILSGVLNRPPTTMAANVVGFVGLAVWLLFILFGTVAKQAFQEEIDNRLTSAKLLYGGHL